MAATLAALVVLGMQFLLPLQAQQVRPADSRVPLSTLEPVKVASGGVFYSKLGGYGVYFINTAQPHGYPWVILTAPEGEKPNKKAMQAAAERFLTVYRLAGCKVTVARDAKSAFLFHPVPERSPYGSGVLARQSLADTDRMEQSIVWLNTVFKSHPQRMEGSCLVWRKTFSAGREKCEMEVLLDLLHGVPACVELRLSGVALQRGSSLLSLLARHLDVHLESPPRGKAKRVGRQFGTEPVGYSESRMGASGKRRLVSLWLLESATGAGCYYLGEQEALRKTDWLEEHELPEKEPIPWPDAGEESHEPASGLKQAAPTESAEAMQGATAPASQPATESISADKKPEAPAPEEARAAYAERLKAL